MRLYFTLLLLLNLITLPSKVQAQDWVQVASLPNAFNETHHSFAFSFDDIGYIVAGNSATGFRDDFYQYNPDTDSWTELPPFPGAARGFAIGDTWDQKAYFGFGRDSGSLLNDDWWVYDIALNTWSQKDDLPSVSRHHPYQFGIGDYVYTGLGHGNGIFNDWFRYDIAEETWTEVATLPADTWDELPPHPGASRWAPASFIINGEVYIINGTSFSEYITDIYKFDLNTALSTTELTNSTTRIYPNPAIDIINIDVPGNLKYQANLYDLNGSVIISTTNKSVMEIQTLPLGIYLLEIKDLDSGQKVIDKIIKG